MLNSGKKFRPSRDKKKILPLVLSEENFLNETKTITPPPPFKLNGRSHTIISCFGKLFSSILNTRLNNFSDDFYLICENQGGFRKGYSTTDNLFILHMLVNIMKCKKKKLFCAFIDFAAAFDTVWRDGLWNKLLINQINGKMYNIIV